MKKLTAALPSSEPKVVGEGNEACGGEGALVLHDFVMQADYCDVVHSLERFPALSGAGHWMWIEILPNTLL